MPDAQGELFGEVGGLFGPETITTTPLDQLDLPREIAPGVILTPTDDDDPDDDDPGPGRCDECDAAARELYVLGDDRAVCDRCRPRETPADIRAQHAECPDCGKHYNRRAQYVTSGDHAAGRPCYSCRGTAAAELAALCYHRAHCGATETNPCTAAPRRRRVVDVPPGALF